MLWDLVTFEFGVTFVAQEPVLNSMLTPLVSIGLGIWAAMRPGGRTDGLVSGTTLFAHSMPGFVVGPVFIIVIAISLSLAPAVPMVAESAPWHRILAVSVLPVAALIVSGVASQFRLLRAGMIEALDSEVVGRARLSGVPEWRLVITCALPVALIPMLNGTAQVGAGIISDTVVIEAAFRCPSIGLELIRAIAQREVPTVQAIAFVAAFAVIVANLLADIGVLALDPRVRRTAHG
ncbi:MAG: ABC transporter permease [Pseudomonadota bacterium]